MTIGRTGTGTQPRCLRLRPGIALVLRPVIGLPLRRGPAFLGGGWGRGEGPSRRAVLRLCECDATRDREGPDHAARHDHQAYAVATRERTVALRAKTVVGRGHPTSMRHQPEERL